MISVSFKPVEVLYALLVLIVAALFWWLVKLGFTLLLLGNSLLVNPVLLIGGIVLSFCVFLALYGLSSAAFRSWYWIIIAALAASLPVIVFNPTDTYSYLVFVLVFLILLIWAHFIRETADNRINLSARTSVAPGLRLTLVLLAVAVSILLYSQLLDQQKQTRALRGLINVEASLVHQSLGFLVKGYSRYDSVDQFLGKLIETPLFARFLNENVLPVGALTTEQSQLVKQRLIEQLRGDFSQRLKVDLDARKPMDETIKAILDERVNIIFQTYSQFFPFGIAVLFLIGINLFNLVYRLLTQLLAWVLYHILRLVKVLSFEEQTRIVKRFRIG